MASALTATSESPTFFGPDSSPLFGVLHLPADRRIRAGVIICGSLGKEGMDSVRFRRILADDLARAGFAVLRFDYLGTGDSSYRQLRDEAVDGWVASVHHAVDYLQSVGATSVSAIGIRAGGLILNRALPQLRAIDRVMYIDPVASGRRYVREQAALFRLSVGPDDVPEGAVSIFGGVLSAKAAKDFGAFKLEPADVDQLWLVRPGDDERMKTVADHGRAHVEVVLGLPEFAKTADIVVAMPMAALERAVRWLDSCVTTTRSIATAKLVTSATMPLDATDGADSVLETIETIEPSGLFAIRSRPEGSTPGAGRVVVFFGTSNDSHVGPSREWVELSRQLAAAGVQAVRWDMSGIGDSGPIVRGQWQPIYSARKIGDGLMAVRHAAANPDDASVVGICSGAWYAAHAARRLRLGSAILVNPGIWNWRSISQVAWQWNVHRDLRWAVRSGASGASGISHGVSHPQKASVRKRAVEHLKPHRNRLKNAFRVGLPGYAKRMIGRTGVSQAPDLLLQPLIRQGTSTTVVLSPPDAEDFGDFGGYRMVDELIAADLPLRVQHVHAGDHAAYHQSVLVSIREQVLDHLDGGSANVENIREVANDSRVLSGNGGDDSVAFAQPEPMPVHGYNDMAPEPSGAKAELRRSFVLRVGAAGAGIISTFLLTVIVFRTLDARDTAAFFAILAALPIGSIVGRLGLGQNVVRLIPAEPTVAGRRIIAGTHLQATVLLTLPTAPLIAACATVGLIGHGDFPAVFVLTSAMIILEAVRTMLSDIFAAFGRVTAAVLTMHYFRSTAVLPVVGIVAFVLKEPSMLKLLTTYTVVAAIQAVVALWFAKSDILIRFSGVFASLRKAIADGSRLFAFEVTAFLIISGTIWLAGAAFSPEIAARYGAAMTIATQVTLLEGLAALAMMPPAARMWAAGRKREVVRLLSDLATLNTVITIVVVAALALFGADALELAYGPSMREAGILLVIIACGGIPQAALSVAASLLIISGEIGAVCRTALLVLAVVIPSAVAAAFFGGALTLALVAAAGMASLYISLWLTARRILDSAPVPHWRVIGAVRGLVSEVQAPVGGDADTTPTPTAA